MGTNRSLLCVSGLCSSVIAVDDSCEPVLICLLWFFPGADWLVEWIICLELGIFELSKLSTSSASLSLDLGVEFEIL